MKCYLGRSPHQRIESHSTSPERTNIWPLLWFWLLEDELVADLRTCFIPRRSAFVRIYHCIKLKTDRNNLKTLNSFSSGCGGQQK